MVRRLFLAVVALALTAGMLVVPGAQRADAASCRIERVVSHGSRGDRVLCVERRLLEIGYIDRSVDTYFGTRTRDAVERLQRNRGLRVTGFVGEQTARSIGIWGRAVPTHRPIEQRRIGTSVNGNSIWAFRYGTPGGTRVVAVGQIHGNEPGGAQIAAYLRVQRKPGGIDLWVVDTVNPDGWRAQRRTNVRGVDLNRNFNSGNWVYSGAGTGSYSGPSAASEPETRAMQGFLDSVRPRLMVVWHQVGRHVDDNRSVANYGLLRRYSTVTGYPIRSTASCTTCGGTLTSYVNRRVSGATAFTVEMPTDFTYRTARVHAMAFLDLAGRA